MHVQICTSCILPCYNVTIPTPPTSNCPVPNPRLSVPLWSHAMADGWNKTNTRSIPEVDYSNTGSGLFQYRKWTIQIPALPSYSPIISRKKSSSEARKKFLYIPQ